jgi:hypothetical protein
MRFSRLEACAATDVKDTENTFRPAERLIGSLVLKNEGERE